MNFPKLIRQLSLIGLSICLVSKAYASYPLWTFTTNSSYPPQVSMNTSQSATVVYSVQNQSYKSKWLVIKPIPGIVQSSTCRVNPYGQAGSSCSLVLDVTGSELASAGVHAGPVLCEANANGQPNPNQCYRPSAVDQLNITVTNPTVGVTISVNPNILLIPEHSAEPVTVTNSASSSAAANNIVATIPGGSGISVQSSTCSGALPIGASCTITFSSNTVEGPITIPVKGDNTNTANVYVSVSDQPLISITGPAQQSRVVSTDGVTTSDLEITNDADSIFNANNITVTDKTACPNLTVDATNCTSVAPGASCQLALSTTTPYAPCTITVSGSNTANSPTTLIAFSHLGGLVFEKSGVNGKVIIDVGSEFISEWTFPSKTDIPGSSSDVDGVSNTNAIVVNSACTGNTSHCAAYRCRNIGADWYLPARNEMQSAVFALCPGSSYPCSFGAFTSTSYWSSTQWFAATNAYSVDVPDGNFGPTDKWSSRPVRCVRAF